MLSPLAKADGRSYPDEQPIIDRDIPTPAAPAPKPVAELARSSPTSLLLPYIDVKIDFDQKIYWAAMRPSRHPMITMELLQDMMCVQESVRAIMEERNPAQAFWLTQQQLKLIDEMIPRKQTPYPNVVRACGRCGERVARHRPSAPEAAA